MLLSLRALAADPAAEPGTSPAECKTEDWAGLAHYRDVNASLVRSRAPRVVFIGDSITESWANETLFREHAEFIGRGISGQTTPQMLLRFHADVIALRPEIVHIMGGTNDVAENTGPETDAQIQAYIEAMVQLARVHGIRVVVASIPPAADFPWRPGLKPAGRIRRLNHWIRSYAAREGLVYADYWSVLATPQGALKPALSPDGVHPNARAYALMQPVAQAAIARAGSGSGGALR
jgi:lysophospholipase L1-like esterase